MNAGSTIVKQRQLAIRREMERRGIALKVVSLDSGIPYATLATYFPADALADPAQIPGGAIYSLIAGAALPSDLLSLLVPDGWHIVRGPAEVDHDAFAAGCHAYLAEKTAAHHPESECGPAIGPGERANLDSRIVHLPITGKVAA